MGNPSPNGGAAANDLPPIVERMRADPLNRSVAAQKACAMTKRQRYLKALRNETVDELVWAPNFDYWLQVNTAEGTVPPQYVGLSRNDIVRAIGGYLWNRASAFKTVLDPCVHTEWTEEGDVQIHWYHTPIGSIRAGWYPTEGIHRSRFVGEHYVKDIESLRVMRYVAEATHYEPDYAPAEQALAETGDDGIVVTGGFCVPFIEFAKNNAGYGRAFYLWADFREEVDRLIGVWFDRFLEGFRVLAEGPGDVVATGDNMDEWTLPPRLFREYAIPFYQEVARITRAHSKVFEGHWCGRTQHLLPLVPGCGLDCVEAIVTEPMASVSLAEALDMLGGTVVLQGGIPSVLACEEGCSSEVFDRYIEETIIPLRRRRGFILGMSDNVPPNADFARVERVARLIA
jgi:hypothetical protein